MKRKIKPILLLLSFILAINILSQAIFSLCSFQNLQGKPLLEKKYEEGRTHLQCNVEAGYVKLDKINTDNKNILLVYTIPRRPQKGFEGVNEKYKAAGSEPMPHYYIFEADGSMTLVWGDSNIFFSKENSHLTAFTLRQLQQEKTFKSFAESCAMFKMFGFLKISTTRCKCIIRPIGVISSDAIMTIITKRLEFLNVVRKSLKI